MEEGVVSVPHTGWLEAEIHGQLCSFDGDLWTSADNALAESLNLVTELVPKTHYTILDVAEAVFRRAGLADTARITRVQADNWTRQLPDGATD